MFTIVMIYIYIITIIKEQMHSGTTLLLSLSKDSCKAASIS
jgi:hypothetical protein